MFVVFRAVLALSCTNLRSPIRRSSSNSKARGVALSFWILKRKKKEDSCPEPPAATAQRVSEECGGGQSAVAAVLFAIAIGGGR